MYYQNPAIQKIIRKRASDGLVIFTDHGEEQSDDRDVTDEEIMKCLKFGIIEGEDWNAKYQDTTYRMARKEGLHSKLIVVVALDATNDLVVTAFRKELT